MEAFSNDGYLWCLFEMAQEHAMFSKTEDQVEATLPPPCLDQCANE